MSSPSQGRADRYFAPSEPASAELREKGSRFLAEICPVADEASARTALRATRDKYRDASHHCWAHRIGWPPTERSSDAGEPSGTAGMPILQVMRGSELSDALLVVTRWFGGTKLGKGGLARAYSAASRAVVGVAPVAQRVETIHIRVELPYDRVGNVKRLFDAPGVHLIDESYGESVCLNLAVEVRYRAEIEAALSDLGPSIRFRSRPGGHDW